MTRFGAILIGAAMMGSVATSTGCNTASPENTHFGRGWVYHNDGRYDKAELEYREVLTVKADTPEVYFNLGQLAEARRDYQKAKGYYEDARRVYPPSAREKIAETHMALGAIFFREAQYAQALDQFQQAAVQNPADHRIFYNVGITLEAMTGRDAEALTAYEKSLALKPEFGPAHLSMAFIYEAMGDIETANLHHSIARQNGEDDQVLVKKLIWWNSWLDEEMTVRSNPAQPKFSLKHPADWRVGSAAQAGTTIVRTYTGTAAIIIGEKSSVQIVGPNSRDHFDRKPADLGPREWAAQLLNGWIAENVPDLAKSITDGGDGGDGSGSGDGEAPKARWRYEGDATAFSYRNGTTGSQQLATYTDANGRVSHIAFHFYLGQENSYVIVTTREDDAEMRITHGLRYVVNYFSELLSNTQ
ncbi:MAG: tetratricopeptide repeat protein [Planctomycetota bacterium]